VYFSMRLAFLPEALIRTVRTSSPLAPPGETSFTLE
jgi:hypothetical protein